ncbi:MAG: hypothetical protein JXD18_01620 [Anaerolineae bacterium]|nr:hypothetical protein [Anaerolineae bacterium]
MKRTDALDAIVIAADRWQQRRLPIWEFSDDLDCILRLGLATASVGVELSDGTCVRPGDTVGVIHLWNERMPEMPATGADVAWARTFLRLMRHSFRLMARHIVANRDLDEIQAFGGQLPLVYTPATLRYLRRLGIEVFDRVPPRGTVETVVDLALRIWTWLMRRAFNPGSVHNIAFGDLDRRPAWISRHTLIERYIKETIT